jgi:spermidine synthase
MDTDPDKWFTDVINKDFRQQYRLEEVLYSGRTEYQSIEVFRAAGLGLCLALDGKIQSSERDESVYHEGLVQPAMVAHPRPEAVFIAGGGEGATLREALRHNSVKRAVLVDIDGEVTALSRKYLPGLSAGAFEDPRTEVHHADARDYLEKSPQKYDVFIIDLPDPIEEGPAYRLFTQEFYRTVSARLNKGGIVAVQAGSASLTELLNLSAVYSTLKSVFPVVAAGVTHIPCFGGPWGFCFASPKHDPARLTPVGVDRLIAARGLSSLSFYDGLTHLGMFTLPRYVREALAGQRRLITDDHPLYLYSN